MIMVLIAVAMVGVSSPDMDPTKGDESVDILFIGNSYTGNLKSSFTVMMAELQPAAKLKYRTPGGCTLARHVADPAVKQDIAGHEWDYVVLQEQSRTPTFATESKAYHAHRQAIETLVGWIRERGAKPVLFETWGRRDGDRASLKRSPDFDAMQAHLTRSYRDAAHEVGAQLVPVGQVWQAVRKANPELGRALHSEDGSHASSYGSYLVAATFLRALIGVDPATLEMEPPMGTREAALIQRTVLSIVDSLAAGSSGN